MRQYIKNHGTIFLGRVGENEARDIVFDITGLVERYGEGTCNLIHQRIGDDKPYPVAVTQTSENVVWTVKDVDVAKPGCGKCELIYMVNNVVAKSYIYTTVAEESMGDPTEEIPEVGSYWLDNVLQYSADAKESAQQAAQSADSALAFKNTTAQLQAETGQMAGQASVFCADALNAKNSAVKAEQNAQNAAGNASDSAENASKSAKSAALSRDQAQEHQENTSVIRDQANVYMKSAANHATNAESAAENASSYKNLAKCYSESAGDSASRAAASANRASEEANRAAASVANAVKTVNGQKPDENGNVEIEVGGSGEGGAKPFIVTVNEEHMATIEYSTDKTSEEIYQAWVDNQIIVCKYTIDGFPLFELQPVVINSTVAVFSNSAIVPGADDNKYISLVIEGSTVNYFESKLATEEFVNEKIAEAALGGNVDLTEYAKKTDVPTKVSQLENDSKYLTKVPDGYAKTEDIPKAPGDIGAQPAGNYALKSEIPNVPVQSVNGKTGAVQLSASDVKARPDSWMPTAQEVGALPSTYTPPNQTAAQVGADPKGTADIAVSQHNVAADAHNDIRQELKAIQESNFITADEAPVQSVNGKTGAVTLDAAAVSARPSDWMPTAENVGAVPTGRKVNGKALSADIALSASDVSARPSTWTPSYSDVGADKSGTASSAVSGHNTNTDAHNDIRLLITGLTTRLDALANSDDDTLDQMAEVVAYIKENRDLIDQITTGKVNVADIVNNLTTNVSNKPLSAAQGVALKALIDAITVPTKLSQLTNDKGYITGYTETDPTVPSWAKADSKPSYSKSEVGLGNVDNVKQYSASNPPPYPVTSVNGKTGAVTVDVPTVPTKVSAFTNDAGYLTGYTETDPTVPSWAKAASKPSYSKSEVGLSNVDNVKQYSASNPPPYPVTSVNSKTGAVSLTASDVGARPSTWMPSASDVGALASASYTTKALTVTYDDGTSETVTLVVAK